MKKLLCLAITLLLILSSVPFAFAASADQIASADRLYDLGLFDGTGKDAEGNPIYTLDRAPTRHEAITMLVRILGKEAEAMSGEWEMPFTDVVDWAKPYVGYAYANGLTSGTGETTFSGNKTVSASQYLTFVLRALGYDDAAGDFQWNAAWELSDEIGLTKGEYNANTAAFLRGDVAKISASALDVAPKGMEKTLLNKLQADGSVGQSRYSAKLKVENGDLYIVTDFIRRSETGSYGILRFHRDENGVSHDTGMTRAIPVSTDIDAQFTDFTGEMHLNEKVCIYKDFDAAQKYWEGFMKDGSFESGIEASKDGLVAIVDCTGEVTGEAVDNAFEITELSVTYDDKGQETYTVKIDKPLKQTGSYFIGFRSSEGTRQSAMISYIRPEGDVLTFTRDAGHFAPAGTEGVFSIIHTEFEMLESGEVKAHVETSAPFEGSL